ncbi:MAG TPA: aspartate 1-decarboxylase [Methanomassiliicoccaceae archaeon]|jgi:aspartate 1-decarboxylase|nr:aspartate 1-decarboxylase [Euryarchaeota archaeon]HOB38674.1 aspartate 1-decarboxylase [Methanomassiliicoccaceae archaeon]HQA21433.1 aspartate 1-decarboxylase [Methanomassiliicoccaceae archaeon]
MRVLLRGKIHRAVVTQADLDYVGSITIDKELLDEADIWPGEKVLISDVDNGARFETYTVEGEPGSGVICVNGAAAHLVKPGDRIIIMAFEITDRPIVPNIVLVDERNRKVKTLHAPGPSVSE